MRYFFNFINYLFHPIFLPLLGLILLMEIPAKSQNLINTSLYSIIHPEFKFNLYIVFLVLTIVAPGFSVLILYWNKFIQSIKMEDQKERLFPFVIVLIYYGINYFFLRHNLSDTFVIPYLISYVFSITALLFLSLLINFYIKISIHAVGIFGVLGAISGYLSNMMDFSILVIYGLLIIAGLIASSRLYLKSHKLNEVILGMFVGFIFPFFCLKYDFYL